VPFWVPERDSAGGAPASVMGTHSLLT
jgi:hypothetical protein